MAEKQSDTSDVRLIDAINRPSDLRKLSPGQLPQVCSELRKELINQLSSNPGHFASSMGAVDLTVALHYVFNTPRDRIVWDVGHQAYSHKLLTGRRERFATNRKLGGLSGFPNPDESEYDTFTAGHASNSISAALGMAVASQLSGDNPRRNVVAVIGDASISGGLAFEGINNAANTPNNLLIILNDNDMSIDRAVGSLNGYLSHITTSKAYNKLRYRIYRALRKMHLISERRRGSILRFNNSLKSLLTHEQNIFEGLNIRYFGPFDGHDVERLVRVLNDIKDMEGPRILHLRTVKGKGYEPAEKDPATWHAPGKFDPSTGARPESSATYPKYQDIFGKTLVQLAEQNPKIVGITAAMPSGTSMCMLQEAQPKRVFDVGISEGHAVTFAGGMAKDGMLPFVAIYSSFLQRGYDHIIHDVAIQRLPVTFCIDRAGLVGEDGVTHHGAFDLCYLRSIPNMVVAAPRNGEMLRNLLYTAQLPGDRGPMAIRYPRGNAHDNPLELPFKEVKIGEGIKLTSGSDVAVISIGTIAREVAKAVEMAKERGISAAHYDAVFVKPIDQDMLREVANLNCPIITVEDGAKTGGFGSAVAEWLASEGISRDLTIIGIPDSFIAHGTVDQLKTLCGLDSASISQKIIEVASNHSSISSTQNQTPKS